MTGDGTGSFRSRLRNAFTREPKCKNLPQKVLSMLPTDDDWADAPPSGFSEDEDANGWVARSAALSPVQPAPRKHTKKKPGKPGAKPAAAPAANRGGGNTSSGSGNNNDDKPKFWAQ
ncbi:hypothetical protein DIPPA_32538 [Diplonema papillatum]|nr:hypothetical protein DIPPA_32538 [Diplonema papillatum]